MSFEFVAPMNAVTALAYYHEDLLGPIYLVEPWMIFTVLQVVDEESSESLKYSHSTLRQT